MATIQKVRGRSVNPAEAEWGQQTWPMLGGQAFSHWFGQGWFMDGHRLQDIYDHSLAEVHAVRVGGLARQAGYVTPDLNNYLVEGVTDSDLIAKGTAFAAGFAAVVRSQNAEGAILSTQKSTADSDLQFRMIANGSLVLGVDNGSASQQQGSIIAGDSTDDWEFVGGSVVAVGDQLTINMYRRGAQDGAMLTTQSDVTLVGGLAGADRPFYMGRNHSNNGAGGLNIAGVCAWYRAPSALEFEGAYQAAKAICAANTVSPILI